MDQSIITKGMEFSLRGREFRVNQVIPESNRVYLEPKRADGQWAGWDTGADLAALQAALYPRIDSTVVSPVDVD